VAASGATGFTSAYVTKTADNQVTATLNADITALDIASDRVWVRMDGVWDDANAVETALSDNGVLVSIAGSNIKIKVYDDVVSPWITSATTIDADGNGYIDHIKLVTNEPIKTSTIDGYVADNAMSNDVSARYKFSGYSGTVKFNFFFDTVAGKTAAAAAGKPVFGSNVKDGTLLFLEIEETKTPMYSVTGLGSTGWIPAITFGTGTEIPTMADVSARANKLDRAPTADGSVKENDKVVDAVGPVLMKAEYATGKVNLYFSEDIADTAKAYKCVDFDLYDTYATGLMLSPPLMLLQHLGRLNRQLPVLLPRRTTVGRSAISSGPARARLS